MLLNEINPDGITSALGFSPIYSVLGFEHRVPGLKLVLKEKSPGTKDPVTV